MKFQKAACVYISENKCKFNSYHFIILAVLLYEDYSRRYKKASKTTWDNMEFHIRFFHLSINYRFPKVKGEKSFSNFL